MPSSRSARRRRRGRSRNSRTAQAQPQAENADALAVSQSGDEEPMKGKPVLTHPRLALVGKILVFAFVAFGIGSVVKLAFSFAGLDTSKIGPIVMVGLLALSIDTASKALVTIATPAIKEKAERAANRIVGSKGLRVTREWAIEKVEKAFEPLTKAFGASLAIFTVAYGLTMPGGENFALPILNWDWAASEPEITAATGTIILMVLRDPENINALVGENRVVSQIVLYGIGIALIILLFIGISSYLAKVVFPLI